MKKSILALTILALLGVSSAAMAAKDPAAAFEKHKQKALANVEKHISCVNAAQDAVALKACFPKAKFDSKAATANFAEHKQKIVDRTAKHRDCIITAQSKEELKACYNKKEPSVAAPVGTPAPAVQ
ncbi:MAG: hypothetical protein WAX77_14110 [Methylococcaceae bacterium]